MQVVEAIHIYLPNPILAQIELPELPQLLKVLNFDDFVIGGKEHLQLLQGAVLEAVQVLQLVLCDVKELEAGHSEEAPSEVLVIGRRFAEEGLKTVVAEPQDFELRQVAKAFETAHKVVGQVELSKLWAGILVKHVFEVAELARRKVKFSHL